MSFSYALALDNERKSKRTINNIISELSHGLCSEVEYCNKAINVAELSAQSARIYLAYCTFLYVIFIKYVEPDNITHVSDINKGIIHSFMHVTIIKLYATFRNIELIKYIIPIKIADGTYNLPQEVINYIFDTDYLKYGCNASKSDIMLKTIILRFVEDNIVLYEGCMNLFDKQEQQAKIHKIRSSFDHLCKYGCLP